MNYKQNLHTHSTYCDGKNTPEELIETALEKGFVSLGFSGHSAMPVHEEYTMTEENTPLYKQHIADLKRQYADRLDIYCGLEADMFSRTSLTGYDYVIGSVHYFQIENELFEVDSTADIVRNVIHTHFGGDGMAYARRYFETLAQLPQHGQYDILGHVDILTKFCERHPFFDHNSKQYQTYAIEAVEAIAGKIPLFELNTGAIGRGYRTSPYPAPFLLKELKRLGFGAVITSDCHDRRFLDCWFDEAVEYLKANGFTERYILTPFGFEPVSL